MNTHVTVGEYATLLRGQTSGFNTTSRQAELPAAAFDALKDLLTDPKAQEQPIFTYGLQRGREVFFLSSWVGVLETPDGTQIEILPKILEDAEDSVMNVASTREIFIHMLAALLNLSPMTWQPATLQAAHMPLLEFFAAQFLHAAARLVRTGLARTYLEVEQDLTALRGRLDLKRHFTHQFSHPTELAVVADQLTTNRPENRLIKMALMRVHRLLRHPDHQRLHTQLLDAFADIPTSHHSKSDLQAWRKDRSFRHYAPIRPLVELILQGHSPMSAQGQARVFTLLFPMEDVFEAYVADCLRTSRDGAGQAEYLRVESQVNTKHLVHQEGRPLFRLRPDLRLTLPDGTILLADTKWKQLDLSKGRQAGVQMADLYQMYAYGQKYLDGTGTIYLIYPHTTTFQMPLPPFHYSGELQVQVRPFHLWDGRLL